MQVSASQAVQAAHEVAQLRRLFIARMEAALYVMHTFTMIMVWRIGWGDKFCDVLSRCQQCDCAAAAVCAGR